MLGFFRTLLMNDKGTLSASEFEYMIDMIDSASSRAAYNESIRTNMLDITRKVENALVYDPTVFSKRSLEKAVKALNRAKVHALTTGHPEDYALFLRLDRITKRIKNMG
ncbi:hypothetical protein JXB01_03845 [Candidatus Micrarchaeota archaeon]|nr:hypothetical protein [Candidatus Micrarchaeota archaeon]